MPKIRWGVLGVAGIPVRRVIPAMQQGELSEIVGIASRNRAKTEEAARQGFLEGPISEVPKVLDSGKGGQVPQRGI